MLKIWEYREKNKTTAYKKSRMVLAEEKLASLSSADPEMPWYGRDPKEIERDPRRQQLDRHQKDLLNRFIDQLWIHKGRMPMLVETIADCIEEDVALTQKFIAALDRAGIIKTCKGYVYIPELLEQYARAVIGEKAKSKSGGLSHVNRHHETLEAQGEEYTNSDYPF